MLLSLFGKRRRVSRKKSKHHRKPPARLLKICKKYHVKATKKVGKKRVYKSVATLKKLCLRKAMALRKKLRKMAKRSKMMKKRSKTMKKRSTSMFGKRRRYNVAGSPCNKLKKKVCHSNPNCRYTKQGCRRRSKAMVYEGPSLEFGMNRRLPMFGMHHSMNGMMGSSMMKPMFGKRRRVPKVSKAKAMKAFRSFWVRHCNGRSRFGSNPSLSESMGGEFCPDGMGGVLGAESTGLFNTSCKAKVVSKAGAITSKSGAITSKSGAITSKSGTAIGSRRRRRRRAAVGGHKKRRTAIGARRRRRRCTY